MGRALFSQKYTSTPVIREEQDPSTAALDVPCERWSAWNQFDPDSEEFFRDAQSEHFIDESVSDSSSSPSTASPTSSTENDDTLSDSNESPMAVGADDPATLLAGAYTPIDWQQRFLEAGSDSRRQGRPTRNGHRGPRRIGSVRQYSSTGDASYMTSHRAAPVSVFVPPAPYRASSTSAAQAQEAPQQASAAPRSPVSRRTVNITPINIPNEPSLPSPVSPSTPTTLAPSVIYPAVANTLTTPSPAPNTTPRIYSWSRFPGVSTSPSRESPLTNPRARLSLSRIDTMSMHQYSAPVPVLDRRY
ncbi:hypothetical protein AN958_12820 [Leucoagaricus sp. SymC.cos]|nr:hypothetical protein AN958_12820 [Leucoagaricus sp. SymC.cos]